MQINLIFDKLIMILEELINQGRNMELFYLFNKPYILK